ncbi:hypothetical protein J6590_100010, partial [Homalodisca vitripennis]
MAISSSSISDVAVFRNICYVSTTNVQYDCSLKKLDIFFLRLHLDKKDACISMMVHSRNETSSSSGYTKTRR